LFNIVEVVPDRSLFRLVTGFSWVADGRPAFEFKPELDPVTDPVLGVVEPHDFCIGH